MGSIASKGASAFRDFNVDGVPASGIHEVDKAGARAAFVEIDSKFESVSEVASGEAALRSAAIAAEATLRASGDNGLSARIDSVSAALTAGATGFVGTSTSSVAIGMGSKSFTVQSGLLWFAGERLRVAHDATNFMEGVVSSYSGAALVLTVDRTGGSGTYATWSAAPCGQPGADGAAGAASPDNLLRQTGMAAGDLLTDVSTSLPAVNRTDGATITTALSHVAGGLQILQSTARIGSYQIGRVLGGAVNKVLLQCTTSVGASGSENGFELNDGGSNWLAARFATNGRINFSAGGSATAPSVLTGLPTWAAGAVLSFRVSLDSTGNVTVVGSNGVANFGFSFVVPPACNNLALVQGGTTTGVWKITQETVSQAALDRINTLLSSTAMPMAQCARDQIEKAYIVSKPAAMTLGLLYGALVYCDPTSQKFYCSRIPTKQLFDTDPGVFVAYVDPVSGSDSSNAGTQAYPFKSASYAIAVAGTAPTILRLKEATYDYLTGFAGVSPSCSKLQIETWASGRAVMTTRITGLTWTSNGTGGYTAALPASIDAAGVFDALNRTSGDDFSLVPWKASAAAASAATGGGWYSAGAGGTITVRMSDGRAPDANTIVHAVNASGNLRITIPWFYAENLDFEGSGGSSYGCLSLTTGVSTTQIFAELRNCSFKYACNSGASISSGNGIAVAGYVGLIHMDCTAAQNGNDGFNYHWDTRTNLAPQIIEINPIARGGGFSKDGSSNASTNHQAGAVLTLNANYSSDNAVVGDVAGSQRWMLGGAVGPKRLNGDADAYGGDALIMAGDTGDATATLTWLDAVTTTGDGSYSDIFASVASSAVYYTAACKFQSGSSTPTKTGGSTATLYTRTGGAAISPSLVPGAGISISGQWPNQTVAVSAQTEQTLTDGATISWNAALGASASVTLGGNRTITAPSNIASGQRYTLRVVQDGTGSRTLTWDAAFKWIGGPPTLSTAAGAIDVFDFYCDGTSLYPKIGTSGAALAMLNGANTWGATQTFGVAIADSFRTSSANINAQTGTSYTLQASDNGKVVTLNNASAVTLTVPSGLGAGFACTIVQLGAGQITFTPSSTTINNRQSQTKTAGQYAVAVLSAYAADTFISGGDMA